MVKIVGLGIFGIVASFTLTLAIWWGIASAAISGLKVGLGKCNESWPAGQVVSDDWFCGK